MKNRAKICLTPKLSGIGGMVTFQGKLAAGLNARGIEITYDLDDLPYESILVIGGTRKILQLRQLKRRGIPIVQRLDGMNWIHRVIRTGGRHWIRAEYGNLILATIRSSLADKIAYQSDFARNWWEREKGKTKCLSIVIHNGVDLEDFSPSGEENYTNGSLRVLIVEGSLLGGYEFGLKNAVKLCARIAHSHNNDRQVELLVAGKVSPAQKERTRDWIHLHGHADHLIINWLGEVPHNRIVEVYRGAHMLFSADINAACPNSVIESLACGTPVIAFETGSLAELLGDEGGITVPYGGDPWQLETPDFQSLTEKTQVLLKNYDNYRQKARKRAESEFGLDQMVEKYLELLLG